MQASINNLTLLNSLNPQVFFEHKLNRMIRQERFRKENSECFERLTAREKEIIQKLVSGLNSPQIAEVLFISRNTVEQHRKNINRKLEVKNLAQLFQYALAFDLV